MVRSSGVVQLFIGRLWCSGSLRWGVLNLLHKAVVCADKTHSLYPSVTHSAKSETGRFYCEAGLSYLFKDSDKGYLVKVRVVRCGSDLDGSDGALIR